MSALPSALPTKAALRARFAQFRSGLDEAEHARRSRQIVERLQRLPEFDAAGTVHLYWPMTARREVDVRALVPWLHAQKKQIVLPVVRTFGEATCATARLAHVRYDAADGLHANKWGILEPSGRETVSIESIEVVVVPALGAGRNGHRIGHGFGYYDEFLRNLLRNVLRTVDVPRIAPVYHECLVEAVPHEPHDVPLTVVVTEHEVVRPAADPAGATAT